MTDILRAKYYYIKTYVISRLSVCWSLHLPVWSSAFKLLWEFIIGQESQRKIENNSWPLLLC